jgi:hypothetical protein
VHKNKKKYFFKNDDLFFLSIVYLFSERERGNQRLSKKLWKNLVEVKIKSAVTNCT